jgi:hypothetical protein
MCLREGKMLIPTIFVGVLAACVQTPPAPQVAPLVPQYTAEQRNAVLKFWAEPGRYDVAPPKDYQKNGLWQVRLTTAGSQWIWNLNRGVKQIPTQDAKGTTPERKAWDAWVDAKVAWDRWKAGQIALEANRLVVGTAPTIQDPSVPAIEPPNPGPMPLELVAFNGDAPAFAEAVVPMSHTMKFDDITLTYVDNVKMRPKYAYYRFEKGVISGGAPVRNMPPEELEKLFVKAGVSSSEMKVMKSVSILEGGFDSVNTYDTGYVSVGFIQFACLKGGSNSLGKLLLNYKKELPERYEQDFRRFGVDVTPDAVLNVLDLQTGVELTGEAAARKIIEDKRLIAVFQRAGLKSEEFNAQQVKAAKALYYPADDVIDLGGGLVSLTGKVSDCIKSEAGMATLMDRKVNTGKLDPLVSILQQIASEFDIKEFSDFATFEYLIVAQLKYRKDYLTDGSLSQPLAPKTRPATKVSRAGTRNGRGRGTPIGGGKKGG